jgi:hypothetical protein
MVRGAAHRTVYFRRGSSLALLAPGFFPPQCFIFPVFLVPVVGSRAGFTALLIGAIGEIRRALAKVGAPLYRRAMTIGGMTWFVFPDLFLLGKTVFFHIKTFIACLHLLCQCRRRRRCPTRATRMVFLKMLWQVFPKSSRATSRPETFFFAAFPGYCNSLILAA